MCETKTPQEPANVPQGQTFDTTAELLAAIQPGMRLCTSDFTGWADVISVGEASIVGQRDSDKALVEVPQAALLDIRGGHCVRLDRVRATIDQQGWEKS